jgi:hypothetical protein
MPLSTTGQNTPPNDSESHSTGAVTPTNKGRDPITGRRRTDADTAIGTTRQIGDAELAAWSKGKRL